MDIFISYRRSDSLTHAGRVHDNLKSTFGAERVFMDVENLAPGDEFIDVISNRLSTCRVFLPIIGPGWLDAKRGWRRRLFEPKDFVRLEIVAALKRPIKRIPVMVAGAKIPDEQDLPDSIRLLTGFQCMSIREDQFYADVMALAEIIKPALKDVPPIPEDVRRQEQDRVAGEIEADRKKMQDRDDRFTRRSLLSAASLVLVCGAGVGLTEFDPFGWREEKPVFGKLPPAPPPPPSSAVPAESTEPFAVSSVSAFPKPRGGPEPIVKLADIWGGSGGQKTRDVEKSGKISFHALGSSGTPKGNSESTGTVAGRLAEDFRKPSGQATPSFLFHLGDVVLYYGEPQFYADQFYRPYRHYPAPILAVAGNHDGMIAPGSDAPTLQAFLENFCAPGLKVSSSAPNEKWDRPAQIQPGVYYTLEAPFVRIFALYSNVLEGPGIISGSSGQNPELDDSQLVYLRTALLRVQREKFPGAVIVAVHHDIYGLGHAGSAAMQKDLDAVFQQTGIWPHAVLSGHAHIYQRYTRTVGPMQIPFIGVGNGGYGLARLPKIGALPLALSDTSVVLASYDNQHLGFLRLTADKSQLRIEYCRIDSGNPADVAIVDLATRRLLG